MKITLSKNSKMQGLLTKDLLQLKNYERTLISFIAIFSIVSVLQSLSGGGTNLFSMFPVMITIGFGMFSIASFNYDEAAKADRYIRSLPVSIKEIVLSKYIFTIWSTVIGALIGISLSSILFGLFAFREEPFTTNILEILSVTLGGILGISIVEAIQIPCIYKFGAEKARMQIFLIMVILIVIASLLVGGVLYWLEKWAIDINKLQFLIPFTFLGLTVLVYNISYKIAYKIYEKKEF